MLHSINARSVSINLQSLLIIQIVRLRSNSLRRSQCLWRFVNLFIIASNCVKTLPKSFHKLPYYSLPSYARYMIPPSISGGVVFQCAGSMQKNFNKHTHTIKLTITGKFQLLPNSPYSRLDATKNTSHRTAAPLRLWSCFSLSAHSVRFLLFLREYFIYIQCFLLRFRITIVSCIMFQLHSLSSVGWFLIQLLPLTGFSRETENRPERISSGVVVPTTCASLQKGFSSS